MTKDGDLLVRRIRNGTVIDHIEHGKSLEVLRALGLSKSVRSTIVLAMNVASEKMGSKDILKIEDRVLTPPEYDRIALISPRATVNVIRDLEVASKQPIEIPDIFVGVLYCPNPTCISNMKEPVLSRLVVLYKIPTTLRCYYCGRIFEPSTGAATDSLAKQV
jgi:aspartate carbamoyltransferase regulatory subunit